MPLLNIPQNNPIKHPSLRGNALVAMMQTTADRERDQLARSVDLGRLLLGNGSFAIQLIVLASAASRWVG